MFAFQSRPFDEFHLIFGMLVKFLHRETTGETLRSRSQTLNFILSVYSYIIKSL